MQRTSDRQKMLAAHGVPTSDRRLPVQVLDLRQFAAVEGRILVHGEDEQSGRRYLMLEGTDAKVHFVYYTSEIEEARSNGELRTNSFVRIHKRFGNGRLTLDIHDFGDAERLLMNREVLGEKARTILKRGVVPTEDGWGGWLGKYQAGVAAIARDIQNRELRAANSADRRREVSLGR